MFKELKITVGENVDEKMLIKAYRKALKINHDYESISSKKTHTLKIKVGKKYKSLEIRKYERT